MHDMLFRRLQNSDEEFEALPGVGPTVQRISIDATKLASVAKSVFKALNDQFRGASLRDRGDRPDFLLYATPDVNQEGLAPRLEILDPESSDSLECANVLKKRRKKMRKHKHKKRLKANRYKNKK
jgi:hypothetical protein